MRPEHLLRTTSAMSPTTCLLLHMLLVGLAGTSAGHKRVAPSSQDPRQQVDPSGDQSALIIDANHHYSNYNYPNSHQPPMPFMLRPHSHSNELPIYGAQSMKNLTASVGRNATFECVFPDLKKDFRLVWMHKDRHTVLAMQDMVIVKNGRVSVRSHANTTFYMTIHDIREEDRGNYMCQVNTVPMRSQLAHLEVNVPPSFVEQLTTSDVDVREESAASLRCAARGRPVPQISWRREDGGPIALDQSTNQTIYELKSDYLNISKTSRTHSGAYLCIASNGIPSPISKRIFLGVSFPPVIGSKKESIGAYAGSSAVLECSIESYPRPSVYWRKDDQMPPIIHSDHKYEISLLGTNIPYRFVVRLKIINVHKSDFGKYTCVVKNALGEEKASAQLQVFEVERKVVPTRRANYNAQPKNILFLTTRNPLRSDTEHSRVTQKVMDHLSEDQESAKTEVFDYETNFISPEMSNEPANKATFHCAASWPALLTVTLILQRVFIFTR